MVFGLVWSILVLSGGWFVQTAEVAQRTTVEDVFSARAETSAQFVGNYTQAVFSRGRVIGAAALQAEISPATFTELMEANGLESAVVLDSNGRALAVYPADPKLLGVEMASKYTHLSSAVAGVPAASNVVPSAVGDPVIAFAVPFDTPTGRRVYSPAYNVARTPLASYLSSDVGQVPEATYLVDAADNVISYGGTEAVPAGRLADVDTAISAAARQPGSSTISVGGRPWRIDTMSVTGTPWRLVFTTPTSLLYGSISPVNRWALRLGMLALVLVGLGALALLERMIRQGTRLVDQQLESAALLDRVAGQRMRIFAQAAESAGDALYSRDADGRILSWNASATELFGWSETEIIGQSLDHPFVGTERDTTAHVIKTVMLTQNVQHVETCRYHRDGHCIELGLTTAPLLDDSGIPVGTTVISRDIGERLRLAEQLRQSEAVFRSAFDDALLGMCLTESDGRVIRVNLVFADLLGRPMQSLVGRQLDDVTHPEYRGRSGGLKEQTLRGEISGFRDETCFLGLEDVPIWAETSVSLVRDQWGEPLHFVTQVVDVTARRAALRERDSRDAMLAAVIANSQSLIYVKDLQGRYLLANEPFQRAFGVTEADLLGSTEVYLQPDIMVSAAAAQTASTDAAEHFEQWSNTVQGKRVYESVTFPFRDPEGRMVAICAVCLDVTERRRAAVAITRARDEAVAATAAKSAFLSTMSHEIRTPMNAVIGMTGLLLDTQLDLQQREFVETIRGSGDALLSIINDILDYSKIEAGQLRLDERLFDLTEMVESAADLVGTSAAEKGLELICFVEADCPAAVVGDDIRLRQVLINLLSNAIKFTASGEVLLLVRAAPGSSDRQTLEFSVRDTGIGIPPERMDRLFRSFSQVDDSTTRQYGGTGLGLVISQRLVQAMGGEITATSTAGVGSVFTFSASLARPSHQVARGLALVPASDPAAVLAGKRALVVDDNATMRNILTLHLARYSMSCVAVGTAADALAAIAGGAKFDLAVLDRELPEVNGMALATALRQEPAAANLPLVLMTRRHWPSEVGPRPVAAVVTKPVKTADLRAALLGVFEPAADAKPDAVDREPTEDPAERDQVLRVLLVEDNVVNQRVAQLMLAKLGHEVNTVSDGHEALAAALSALYDVILMDVQMPVMDGLEATRRIRSELAVEFQPYIIAMTASALVEHRSACLEAGMDGFLSKPVRRSELRRAVNQPFATRAPGSA